MNNTQNKNENDEPSLCCPFGSTPGYPCRICRASAITFTNGMKSSEKAKWNRQAEYSQSIRHKLTQPIK